MKVKYGEASCTKFKSFEYSFVQIALLSKSKVIIVCIYRLQEVPCKQFCNDLKEFIKKYFDKSDMIIFVGDFNVWIDEKENSNTKKLLKIMNKYCLSQLVQEPTHKDGHRVDHVYLNRKKLEVKSNAVVDRYGINTDHFPIIIELLLMEKEIKKNRKEMYSKDKRRKHSDSQGRFQGSLSEWYLFVKLWI